MDDQRFDEIVRAVGSGASRRSVLGTVAGGLLAALGGREAAGAPGNSACDKFCKEVFPPGRERGRCVSAAARGDEGNLCAACGADPANVCLDDDGQPTCDCGCAAGTACPPGIVLGCNDNPACFCGETVGGGTACVRINAVGSGGRCSVAAPCPPGEACIAATCPGDICQPLCPEAATSSRAADAPAEGPNTPAWS